VGWEGSLTALPADELRMHDDFSGATDVYHWRVQADRLRLTRVSSNVPRVYGIPYQVYDAAYMSDWWDRSDCTLQRGQDC
jgi:hypothetical protein